MKKGPDGLQRMLELGRLTRNLRTPGDIKTETARLAFEALNKNKAGAGSFTRSMEKLNRKEQIQSKIESGEQIIVENCNELLEFIACVLGKDTHEIGITHFYTHSRFEEAEFLHIFVFFGILLGFSSSEIRHAGAFAISENGMKNTNILELTRNHIMTHRPEILELGKRIKRTKGMDFNSPLNLGEAAQVDPLKATQVDYIQKGKTIKIRLGTTQEETFDNICRHFDLDIGKIFQKKEIRGNRRYLNKEQNETLSLLGHILASLCRNRGAKTELARIVSEKTGVAHQTIYIKIGENTDLFPHVIAE